MKEAKVKKDKVIGFLITSAMYLTSFVIVVIVIPIICWILIQSIYLAYWIYRYLPDFFKNAEFYR